jgi:hypothetical protein
MDLLPQYQIFAFLVFSAAPPCQNPTRRLRRRSRYAAVAGFEQDHLKISADLQGRHVARLHSTGPIVLFFHSLRRRSLSLEWVWLL